MSKSTAVQFTIAVAIPLYVFRLVYGLPKVYDLSIFFFFFTAVNVPGCFLKSIDYFNSVELDYF